MTLDELRKAIDRIDENILNALNQRAEYVIEIGKQKRASNQEIFVPEREKAIIERLNNLNKGPLSNDFIHQIFYQIIEIMRKIQT